MAPATADPFEGTRMEAAEMVATCEAVQDRTVASLLEPGLEVAGRSVRPARAAVFRSS